MIEAGETWGDEQGNIFLSLFSLEGSNVYTIPEWLSVSPSPWGLHLLRFLPQMLHHFMLLGGLSAMQPLLSDKSTDEIPAHSSTDHWLTVVATEGHVRLPTLWWDWFISILVSQQRYPPLPHPGPCVQKPALCLKLGTHCLFCISNSRKSMSSFL